MAPTTTRVLFHQNQYVPSTIADSQDISVAVNSGKLLLQFIYPRYFTSEGMVLRDIKSFTMYIQQFKEKHTHLVYRGYAITVLIPKHKLFGVCTISSKAKIYLEKKEKELFQKHKLMYLEDKSMKIKISELLRNKSACR